MLEGFRDEKQERKEGTPEQKAIEREWVVMREAVRAVKAG
jgi:hypothetical protein